MTEEYKIGGLCVMCGKPFIYVREDGTIVLHEGPKLSVYKHGFVPRESTESNP
jgi:hypothetical protein